jgi:hypothetical protein
MTPAIVAIKRFKCVYYALARRDDGRLYICARSVDSFTWGDNNNVRPIRAAAAIPQSPRSGET